MARSNLQQIHDFDQNTMSTYMFHNCDNLLAQIACPGDLQHAVGPQDQFQQI